MQSPDVASTSRLDHFAGARSRSIDVIGVLALTAMIVSGRFVCTPVAVYDGDGPIWCAEGPHIRLAGIAAREMDGSCRRGHPCPRASGTTARGALLELLGGARGRLASGHVLVRAATMRCIGFGSAKGDRTAALCDLPGVGDLSCAMVRTGTVLPWPRFGGDRLCHLATF